MRLFIEGVLVGLFSGLIVILYRFLIEKAEILRTNIYSILSSRNLILILGWFVILAIIGLFLGYLSKDPMLSGSGIPQVKGILMSQSKMNWLRVLLGKFFVEFWLLEQVYH